MTVKDWVDILQFVLNIILGGFTVYLFRQGQKDRRVVRLDKEREQASKVSILRDEDLEPSPGGGQSILGATVEIRNDSTLPVTGVRLYHCQTNGNSAQDDDWMEIDLGNDYRGQSLPGGAHRLVSSDSALMLSDIELYFVDGAGKAWVRRGSDGTLWVNTNLHMPRSRRHDWYQARSAGKLGWLFDWPIKRALQRAVKIAPRIPWEARLARFLWGSAAPAMPDPQPWRRPHTITNRDWPYQNLISLALYKRENPVVTVAEETAQQVR